MRRTLTMAPQSECPSWGSRLMLYGALALILLSGYVAYLQVDTSWAWIQGVINTNRDFGAAFQQLILMFQTTAALRLLLSQILFLLALVILALVVIRTRRITRACMIVRILCALSVWVGCALDLFSIDPERLLKMLYTVPLLVIAAGCILQLVHSMHLAHGVSRSRHSRRQKPKHPAPQPVQRSVPTPQRQYRNAPGATRMLPDAEQQFSRPVQPVRPTTGRQQPVVPTQPAVPAAGYQQRAVPVQPVVPAAGYQQRAVPVQPVVPAAGYQQPAIPAQPVVPAVGYQQPAVPAQPVVPAAGYQQPAAPAQAVRSITGRQQTVNPAKAAPQYTEKPVPGRAATHLGQPEETPPQPRYQWRTIKQKERNEVIGQK